MGCFSDVDSQGLAVLRKAKISHLSVQLGLYRQTIHRTTYFTNYVPFLSPVKLLFIANLLYFLLKKHSFSTKI